MELYTSDWHLQHSNLYKPDKCIPKRLQFESYIEADEMLRQTIKETCTSTDIIHHLGDIGSVNTDPKYVLDFIKSLPGTYVLYSGNHDIEILKYLKRHNYTYNKKPKMQFVDVGTQRQYNKHIYNFTHYPLGVSIRGKHFNVHGHLHEKTTDNPKQLNISIDSMDIPSTFKYGQPLTIDEIETLLITNRE